MIFNDNKDMKKTRYISPDFKTVMINVSRIVCQSPVDGKPLGAVQNESYTETELLDW